MANFRISEDSKTYFLTLKNSAYFQDGTPVTIDDVIFTFEKVIVCPEEKMNMIFSVYLLHLFADPLTALCTVLALVVGWNWAIGTGELAAQGHNQRSDWAVLVNLLCGKGVRAQCGQATGRLKELIA